MKVLYLLHSTIMGGATISFLNMAKGLSDRGVEIVVAAPSILKDFEDEILSIGGRCYAISIAFSAYPESLNCIDTYTALIKIIWVKIKSFISINKIINIEKPDIIHSNSGVIHEGYICAKIRKVPHVWHLREYQDKDFKLKIFPSKKWIASCFVKSFVISITKDILHAFGMEEDCTHRVIYNAVLPSFSVFSDFPKEKYFLCASRISREKGLSDTVRGFAEFHKGHPCYKLIILGDGDKEYCQSLKELSKSCGCENAVLFKGYKKDVVPYMKKATALIVASYNEGFGRMTAEAAFCGCVVLGRATAGTKEILDETGGYMFSDVNELVDKMNLVSELSDKAYCCIVKSAQNRAVELYSTENNISSIISYYDYVLSTFNSKIL